MKLTVQEAERDFARRDAYTRPQPDFPLTVVEYRLSEEAGIRTCMLRFAQHESIVVDELTLMLTMLDAGGAEIGRREVIFRSTDLPQVAAGETMVPLQAIPLDRRCAEVCCDIRKIVSGDYHYHAAGSRVVLDYCPPMPWRYDAHAGASAGLSDTVPLRVRSGRVRKVRFLWPMAALGLLLLLAYLCLPILTSLGENRSENFTLTSEAEPLAVAVAAVQDHDASI